ncbi:hypothetical protein CPS_0568 [Colwellia psychrerythraea 34H]|uniref:Uncharacterized protein n=1 Tax=Colwellia psychrerythraea (strain 34H / ATCC BAA-681) TaxID=167879 RepID=Q489E6_COLP3|nr:hypothetical protein CPS_0568 [Colwellia psychrerythraea 34H]
MPLPEYIRLLCHSASEVERCYADCCVTDVS